MKKKHDGPHKYQLVDIGRNKKYLVYRCMLPNCTHYLPHRNLIIGKESLCSNCSRQFIIGKDETLVKPVCHICRAKRSVKLQQVSAISAAIENDLSDLFDTPDDEGPFAGEER